MDPLTGNCGGGGQNMFTRSDSITLQKPPDFLRVVCYVKMKQVNPSCSNGVDARQGCIIQNYVDRSVSRGAFVRVYWS